MEWYKKSKHPAIGVLSAFTLLRIVLFLGLSTHGSVENLSSWTRTTISIESASLEICCLWVYRNPTLKVGPSYWLPLLLPPFQHDSGTTIYCVRHFPTTSGYGVFILIPFRRCHTQ
jgi:hypothetical protein